MWIVEFLLGILIAYLIMSPRLRRLLFRQNHTPSIQTMVKIEEQRSKNSQLLTKTPTKQNIIESSTPIATYGKAVVEEDKIAKWLRENKELREINGIRD